VGDNDELGPFREFLNHLDEFVYVCIVQRCIHFVQKTERRGLDHVKSKDESNGHQGLLAARQEVDILKFLSTRLGDDIYPCGGRVLFVEEDEARLSSLEKASQRLL